MIKLNILAENRAKRRGILGEHGLSMLVEIEGYKVLFDTGQTDVFLKNAKMDGVDISKIDALVISHGHYDHTGGVPEFCRINKKALIYMHPDAFCERYNSLQGKPTGNCIGIPWSSQDKDSFRNRMVYEKEPAEINKNILLSGELTENPIKHSMNFVKRDITGGFEEDRVADEQFMIVRGRKGVYIFVGCSHPGILNCISYTKKLFPNVDICAAIGGMHLEKHTIEQLAEIDYGLKSLVAGKIIPLHCTGILASCYLRNSFGDNCLLLNSGDELILEE